MIPAQNLETVLLKTSDMARVGKSRGFNLCNIALGATLASVLESALQYPTTITLLPLNS
jgi:hypothetical protein